MRFVLYQGHLRTALMDQIKNQSYPVACFMQQTTDASTKAKEVGHEGNSLPPPPISTLFPPRNWPPRLKLVHRHSKQVYSGNKTGSTP